MSGTEALPRFACPDWWEKLQRGETPMPEVPLDPLRAAKVLAFFNRLRLPDVPGAPTMAEACGDWFRDILVAFLASQDPKTMERVVWECLCMVPKKNSKSTYTSALALTALYMEDAPNRQMLVIGPSQNISERCFDQAQGMIRLDARLEQIFKVQDHLKTITRRKTGTKLEVMTFDPSIVTGEIPVLTIIDEVHELGKKNAAQSVMQQIRGGGITMQGGQVMMITTQSDKAPAGIWATELKKARAIRDGKGGMAPIMLPVLYEFPHDLQKTESFWRDRNNWHLVLPNLGLSINRQRLEDDYENNGKVNPLAEQIWVSQHLNIEIGVGLGGDWIGATFWEAAKDALPVTLETIRERCDVAVVGIDGGGADDLLGLCVTGRCRETMAWLAWFHAWAHPTVLDRRKEIVPVLRDFEAAGDLTICAWPTQDFEELTEIVGALNDDGLLPAEAAIGLDPAGVAALVDELTVSGIALGQMNAIPQNYTLSKSIWGMERKLMDGTYRHGGQPMMAWVLGNARAEQKGNAVQITKQAAGKAKIDPLMAGFNAFALMARNPQAGRAASYLDTEELLVM
jgi:phage terminase large subunit-like protein